MGTGSIVPNENELMLVGVAVGSVIQESFFPWTGDLCYYSRYPFETASRWTSFALGLEFWGFRTMSVPPSSTQWSWTRGENDLRVSLYQVLFSERSRSYHR